MATITLFDVPSEVITGLIYSRLPNAAFLCMRLVSKAARKSITDTMEASHIDYTLEGRDLEIRFKGDFKTAGPAFFQFRMKMSALNAHPELKEIVASVRSEMQDSGHKGPFTVQSFIDYSSRAYGIGTAKYLILALRDQTEPIWLDSLPLALVPFDFCNRVLSVPHERLQSKGIHPNPKKNELLEEALSAAAEKNSLELVTLVLSHPNARHLGVSSLNTALKEAKPKDPRIKLAIDKHKDVCKKLGSPTNPIVHEAKVHFVKNPKKNPHHLN